MSFAFMPIYTGDYARDTQHLSMSEHGAYFKLLMFCWDQKGPAPLDERRLMGICNARSTDEIETLRRVLAEFFVRMDDGFYNPRMQREIERSEALSRARSDAGRKGYEAKAKQLPSNCQASASTPTPTPILTPSPTPTEKQTSSSEMSFPPPRGLRVEYQKVVDCYHERLPQLPRCLVLSDSRKRAINGRWRQIAEDNPDPEAVLKAFRDYFTLVSRSDFLTGKKTDFVASLDWLCKADNFAKVIEGRYDNVRAAA